MIVFFSSFLSPHIKPLCDVLYHATNGEFIYVEVQKLSEERRAMGYSFAEQAIPYLRSAVNDRKEWKRLVEQADCILINPGSSDYELAEYCVASGKIVFLVSERIFKRGVLKLLDRRLWLQRRINLMSRYNPVYLLCLGSYVARDFALIGFPKNKTYKFGYFPDSLFSELAPTHDNIVLWVGRMIDWKRPLFAVKTAELLKKKGNLVKLVMVGDGPMLNRVRAYVASHNLEDCVDLKGFIANEQVRVYMRSAKALLITSNRREGWGAVVNEALDAGVPVISAAGVGAAGYLIRNGVNGYIYPTYSIAKAADAIVKLTPEHQQSFNAMAKETLNVWNAEEAGRRFLDILNRIEGGCSVPDVYAAGPMSKA